MTEKAEKIVTRAEKNRWEAWADTFRFGAIGLLFVGILYLETLPDQTAQAHTLWLAGIVFVIGTIGFILGSISVKKTRAYFSQQAKALDNKFKEIKR